MLQSFITKYNRWINIQNTVSALNSLSAADLDDIGIPRHKIRQVAERAEYKGNL